MASYDVRAHFAPQGKPFGAWATVTTARGSALSRTIAPSVGGTTCYAVRGRGLAGDIGSWSTITCVSTVVDDRRLTVSGGTRLTGSRLWAGTQTRIAGTGASLRLGNVSTRSVSTLTLRPTSSSPVLVDGVIVPR
ncbi:hypothetical protein [Phycicoccus duodecadis]|uniref:Uncharacterized protein n=1 Tax=Phycicoccus duodecadis TaxID=173053 RepID=A0A2N3YJU6_9MICO|nr:hypothetical protein [Phycicoccus duodecadis]PKW27126.1 hypothetical protein ATL31_1962 [Phycicoccus duodecadis]